MNFHTHLLFVALGCSATLAGCTTNLVDQTVNSNTNSTSSLSPAPASSANSNANSNSISHDGYGAVPPPEASTEDLKAYKEAGERCDHTPVPKVTAYPKTGVAPLTVTFDGGKSYDPDKGKVVGWKWYFEDGTIREGRIIKYTFDKPGKYGVSISVLDSQGQSSFDCSSGILAAYILVTDSKSNH